MPQIFSRYDPPGDQGISFTLPSRAQQHFKDECDINNIIARFTKTGVLPQIATNFDFGDASEVPSYQEAMNFIIDAQDRFMELPAKVRKEFENDPGQFLSFVDSLDDPENYARAVALGLAEPKNQPEGHPTSVPEAEKSPVSDEKAKAS